VSGAYRSFAYRIDLDVAVERVWRAFTDSRVLARWAAPGATITPREKGRMHVVFGGDVELDAHIDVLVTAQRMRLILLPTPGMPRAEKGVADAVIVEDLLFERGKDMTTLRLLSSGVPASQGWVTYYLNKRRYWELALTRLKVFLEKGLDQEQPGPRY
jgi:uncharacterized protein YndB with AHSA1/START domain